MLKSLPLAPRVVAVLLLICTRVTAEEVGKIGERPDAWFDDGQGRRVIDNIITWQKSNGGWWKAYDASRPNPAGARAGEDSRGPATKPSKPGDVSTFDNKATYTELRLLARAFRVTQEPRYREAFERGLKFVFDSQYPNGGWPQRFPLQDNYGRHITFNDNAMAGVMALLKDVADAKADFAWLSDDVRQRARQSFDRGVQCILDCQIKVDGTLTGWCQQHDAKTLAPAAARSYELPSISGGESTEIVMLLMQLDDPGPRVRQSVRAAVAWLERSKITGKRLAKQSNDLVLVDDPAAEPLWARFYDIETNRPFFCGRDGVKKWSLAEIERERRTGYAWMRPWGAKVLTAYPTWAAKHGQR
jgi:PelA/Pel-15E family pectate lyase